LRRVGKSRIPELVLNGRLYSWPVWPIVVICIDGGAPGYIEKGLKEDLLPNIKKFREEGFYALADGAMPSFTNPNNLSIVTGSPPSVHGISGNFFLDPETGAEVMMNDPAFLRSETILARVSQKDGKVAVITAKDKLRKMLGHNLREGICFSSEKSDQCTREENGIEKVLDYVGLPLPDVYSAELSLFVVKAGVKILERERPDIMYLSLTDYIQHKFAPGAKESNEFYHSLDEEFGKLADLGAIVALTADHGMNDKANPDGSPKVIFLQDLLDQKFGKNRSRVICPITDPYVVHHGSLGSFVTVFGFGRVPSRDMIDYIQTLSGIEKVMEREEACSKFELPLDRIGDVVVTGDAGTVIGSSPEEHDLSGLADARLRSHGGLAEQEVPFILSRPLNDQYAAIAEAKRLRNFDLFEFAINGTF